MAAHWRCPASLITCQGPSLAYIICSELQAISNPLAFWTYKRASTWIKTCSTRDTRRQVKLDSSKETSLMPKLSIISQWGRCQLQTMPPLCKVQVTSASQLTLTSTRRRKSAARSVCKVKIAVDTEACISLKISTKRPSIRSKNNQLSGKETSGLGMQPMVTMSGPQLSRMLRHRSTTLKCSASRTPSSILRQHRKLARIASLVASAATSTRAWWALSIQGWTQLYTESYYSTFTSIYF